MNKSKSIWIGDKYKEFYIGFDLSDWVFGIRVQYRCDIESFGVYILCFYLEVSK